MPLAASTLLEALAAYLPSTPEEERSLAAIRDFVNRSPLAFSRSNLFGHVTASAIVTRDSAPEFLLLWHRKLDRWLQPGGHVELDDDSVFAAALRETREETGVETFRLPIAERILDVDVHPIPAHGSDPPHFHYDIRHLLAVESAPSPLPPRTGWFSLEQARASGIDSSLERALRKAVFILGKSPAVPTTYHLPPTT